MTDREHPPHSNGGGGEPWWRSALAALGLVKPSAASCGSRALSPDEEIAVAYRAFSDGDLAHAAHHVGGVLMADPDDRRAHDLLDRMVDKADDPLAFAPLGTGRKGTWAGTAAVRAAVLARLGRHSEALDVVLSLEVANVPAPFWRWPLRWLAEPAVAQQVDPRYAYTVFGSMLKRFPGTVVDDPAARADLTLLLPAAETTAGAHPSDGMLLAFHAMVVRKLGRTDEALRLAAAAFAASPSYMSATGLAMARQAAGDVDGAVAGYREGLRFEPNDPGPRADVGLMLLEHERFAEALVWAKDALDHDPDQETAAAPLVMLLNFRLGLGREHLDALHAFAHARPGHGWARDLVARVQPYVHYLPDATDATINLARQIVEAHGKSPKGVKLRVTVSSIEAPSVRLAVATQLGSAPGNQIDYDVGEIPTPDPRVARGPVEFLLWRCEGTDPHPVPPAPPAPVSEAVAAIAGETYDLDRWSRSAREAGRAIGPGGVGDVLAAMVHPPPRPAGVLAWDWLRQVQVAAALVASHVDDGWADAARRRALVSLARGPVDWTTEAGVVALGEVARENDLPAAARAEIVDVLAELADNIPDRGHCVYPLALWTAVRRLPNLDDATHARFKRLEQWFDDERGEAGCGPNVTPA